MDKMKVIAFYLPQFHSIPENNEWWGQDFTEWVNVKNGKPLFENHVQPKIPLNHNYYDLLNDSVKEWQSELANRYGVYGFCYYHYWFNGKLLLEKPMEQMLNDKNITTHYCICWANASWTKTWVGDDRKVLIPQTYGGEDEWKAHYDYCSQFFKDERYITCNGKPLFVIYKPEDIPNCSEMMDDWNKRAVADGFPGLTFAFQTMGLDLTENNLREKFDYDIEFQPSYGLFSYDEKRNPKLRAIKRYLVAKIGSAWSRVFKQDLAQVLNPQDKVRLVDYDKVWEIILSTSPYSNKSIPGAYAKWDNTPRKSNRGAVHVGSTPEKFRKYLSEQIARAINVYKSDMIFVYAWNEWAEGGFLEPDEEYGYGYLEAIKEALKNNNCL